MPDVRVSDRVNTPLVAGFGRPVVLLPAGRFEALTPRQQEMAICHELTHLKRADLWLGCVPALAERLFFFHPLAHVVARDTRWRAKPRATPPSSKRWTRRRASTGVCCSRSASGARRLAPPPAPPGRSSI